MVRNIYFLLPLCSKSAKNPSGGVQKDYFHVNILRDMGYNAYILHTDSAFRYQWWSNQTPVAYMAGLNVYLNSNYEQNVPCEIVKDDYVLYTLDSKGKKVLLPAFSEKDILVIPEYEIQRIGYLFEHLPVVIYNMTCYFTFHSMTLRDEAKPSLYNTNILGCLVGSQDTHDYLQFTYPTLKLHRYNFGVDTKDYYYTPKKKKQIAYLGRKLESHMVQIVNILKTRNQLTDWKLIPLLDLEQEKYAQIVRESAIFLSSSYQEGFGLPPAEAMACGAIAIGYHGEGGREFFKEPYAYPIPHGEIINFVKKVEEVATDYDANPATFEEMGRQASEFILKEYSDLREKETVRSSWQNIIDTFNERKS